MTETNKEDKMTLKRVSCVYFSHRFGKDTVDVRALIDSGSEVNAITLAYISKLDLRARHTNVGAQKIDDSILQTFGMVLASFQVEDKLGRVRFFQETILLADISVELVLGMPFLTPKNADVQFVKKKLTWRSYTNAKALPTTKRIELINKKEFTKTALDGKSETFVVHVTSFNVTLGIHWDKAAQIALLLTKKVKIPDKYSDFVDVFSEERALVLPERTKFNEHTIDLEDGKQPFYRPIYSLDLVELETLKTYIETYLKIGFIWSSKSLAGAFILFDKKPDGILRLCIDYWGLNNLTIKNQYPLLPIGKSLDRLDRAKRFTQLDLTSAYHQIRIKKGDE